jgi:hypothetical protein
VLRPTPDFQAADSLKSLYDAVTYFAGAGKDDPLKFIYLNIGMFDK